MAGIKAPKVKTAAQMKAEMAVGRARNVLPQAERETNKAKFLEGSQFPRGYHGTTSLDEHSYDPEAITRFNDYKPVWAAKNPSIAEEYIGHESGATYPLHISAKNPLKLDVDMNERVGSSPEMQKMFNSFGIEYDKNDPIYRHVNTSQFRDAAQGLGYDSIIANERGEPTVGVFSSAQLKSATGNRGTFSLNEEDIGKAEGGEVKPPAVFERAQVPFEEVRRQLGMNHGGTVHMKDGGDPEREFIEQMREGFSVYNKPTYGSEIPGTPTIDQQRYALTMKGQQEAENRERVQKDSLTAIDPSGTLGVTDVLSTIGKGIVAIPVHAARQAMHWLQGGKQKDAPTGKDYEEWMQPKTQEGAEFLETIGEIPEKITGSTMGFGMHPNLWVSGLGTPTPAQMRAGLRLGSEKYGVPLAEKGLSMWESGRDPFSVVTNRMTGSTGNPMVTEIFAGPKSKTADLAMRDIAEARLNAGEDPAKVWSETGWARPPYGGDLRYEISDTGLSADKVRGNVERKSIDYYDKFYALRDARKIRSELDSGKTLDEAVQTARNLYGTEISPKAIEIANDPEKSLADINREYYKVGSKSRTQYLKTTGKLGKQIEHPEFFAAYPDMADLIKFETMSSKTVGGELNPHQKKLRLNLDTIRLGDPESLAAHELQHAVQHREGTAPGGSPAGIKASPQMFDPDTFAAKNALTTRVANDTGRLGELHRKAEAGNITSAERQELVGLTQALPEYSAYQQAGRDFLSQGTPKELYRRLAGEAEARLAQHRLKLTPEERLSQYPYDPAYFKTATGYSIDDIINNIVRPNSSISSAGEMSVPQMKAELRERVLAPANPQGFYSATEAAALNLQRKSGSGQAFLNDLLKQENVRPDEISSMGLDTWLKGKKDVTAAEVQDYIAKNKIQLGESTYKDMPKITPEQKTRLSALERGNFERFSPDEFDQRNGTGSYQELLRLQNARDRFGVDQLRSDASRSMKEARRYQAFNNQNGPVLAQKYIDKARILNDRADLLEAEMTSAPPKFKQWSLPGGENYREVVITLPSNRPSLKNMSRSEYNAAVDAADKTGVTDYKSTHWDEPNPLAHLRMSDRVTDGKKTLLVDEVQSDWHQEGREKGYRKNDPLKKNADGTYTLTNPDGTVLNLPSTINAQTLREGLNVGLGVPDAPFKDDWYQLALKRAIKEAIDGGYDRVALPTGSRVAERFDLSKQIDRLDYNINDDGTYSISGIKNGREVVAKEGLTEKELADNVGKEVAEKMIKGEGKNPIEAVDRWEPEDGDDTPLVKSLSGLDLSVGGKGMKKYYDEIYPGYLKKFGKRYGSTVGTTRVEIPPESSGAVLKYDGGQEYANGQITWKEFLQRSPEAAKEFTEPLHYMDITPAMREAFKTGIHMKRGGKVSFANDIDAMRLELSKG